ncbi:PTS sugar transporter subunit IIA [bacterium]|nr:PTS sugar transporter subunit IIA [bacterium]
MVTRRDIRLFRLLRPEFVELWEEIENPVDRITGEAIPLSEEEVTVLVIRRCAEVLDRTGMVKNVKRLGDELLYRESQAPTALGRGIAIPHVRSKNVKDLIMCLLRYPDGANMESLDREPVYLVFGIATPYFDDANDYQKIYRKLFSIFDTDPSFVEELMAMQDAGEIVRILRQRD